MYAIRVSLALCLLLSRVATCQKKLLCNCTTGSEECVNGTIEAYRCYLFVKQGAKQQYRYVYGGFSLSNSHPVGHRLFCYSPNKTVQCCHESNFCNGLQLTPPTTIASTVLFSPGATKRSSKGINQGAIIGLIIGIAAFVACLVIVFLLVKRDKNRQARGAIEDGDGSNHELDCRTMSREIDLIERLSKGTYGETHRGNWRGRQVAVRIFRLVEEERFNWEIEVYQICMLYHENIVELLSADRCYVNSEVQLWSVTAFHPHGSLSDFLQHARMQYDQHVVCKLACSLAWGLVHLHRPIVGAERCSHSFMSVAPKGAVGMGNKPAVAHTSLTSRNVLVKDDLTCCISDLSKAVLCVEEKNEIQYRGKPITRAQWFDTAVVHQKGALHFAAPEVLDGSLCLERIEMFRQVDMYAFALILWQMAWGCKTGDEMPEHEYRLPHSDVAGADATLEQMKNVVCGEMHRPPIPAHWCRDKEMAVIEELIMTCWKRNPNGRFSSSYVHKRLERLLTDCSQ